MRRKVEHRALSVVGYAEPWTGVAGTRQLSLSTAFPVDAVRIVRLDRDDMPAVDWPVRQLSDAVHEQFAQGAWARLDGIAALGSIEAFEFEILLTRNPDRRVLLDAGSFAFLVSDGRLVLRHEAAETELFELPLDRWMRFRLDLRQGVAIAEGLEQLRPFSARTAVELPEPQMLTLCSDAAEGMATLNCRLGRIRLAGTVGWAEWRFPTLFTSEPLLSNGVALHLYGNPTFCVTSARFDGSVLDPRLAPEHYDAVHFHDTDMAGLDWPARYDVTVPQDAPSGVYAFEVSSAAQTERIAFFVAPAARSAELAFVVPTSTYLAYADEYLPPHLYEWLGSDRGHEFARDNELRSLYDYHRDGSGVSLVSTRKPKATLRHDYRYPLCGDPHNLPVDLHFLRFCARSGIVVDVLTDRDLHGGGVGLVQGYRAVLTGSHPEYLSVQMEQAYRDYVAGGGRLAYLGGNGFAATVGYRDDLMELRRGPTQAGRTWDGPLAEMNLALTNEPGGYLRDRGRGEYSLVGVGISLMGFSHARPFSRTDASREAEFAWLFDGVGDTFGDSGIVLGGAAGYEVDAVNSHLGSPDDIVVLATATGFSPSYVDDCGRWFEGGEPEREAHRRADMTLWQHPSGGLVFSASSVAFLGALPGPGEANDVGRLTFNLLRRLEALDINV